MTAVILDTNMLLAPYQLKLDVLREVKRVCNFPHTVQAVDKTVEELQYLITKGSREERRAATFGLQLMKAEGIPVLKTKKGKTADQAILELEPRETVVATRDKALKTRLKEKGFQVLSLRQQRHLELE